VYAIGDLIGIWMLAHAAEEEGVVAARNAVGEFAAAASDRFPNLESVDYDCMPACVYTFPEAAVVGHSREGAKERGVDAVQSVVKYTANGKALAEGDTEGFVQLVAENGTGRIVGCQIVGPHAVETIHEVALAMSNGLTVKAIAETVHAHPSVSEVIKMAAVDAVAKCGL
jgi:dihydrolipoamide dehydrogenase